MIKKPMKAVVLENLDDLFYPCYCTPKLDGIRCLIINGVAVSKKFKPIRNKFVQNQLRELPEFLDGELVTPGNFNEVSSAIMSEDGTPDFKYYVFDYGLTETLPYIARMQLLKNTPLPKIIDKILPERINSKEEFLAFEKKCLDAGYEGVMIRKGDGQYKFGQSTLRQGWLLKWKRFMDSEATIIGFEEKMHNDNPAEKDALGHTKRSSAKENLTPAGTLGTLIVQDIKTKVTFGIGTGLDDVLRQEIWNNRDKYMGKLVKYKYQPHGGKDLPRFPSFLGFRHEDDMDKE